MANHSEIRIFSRLRFRKKSLAQVALISITVLHTVGAEVFSLRFSADIALDSGTIRGMDRVVLIHWKAQEVEKRIQLLAQAGYQTQFALPAGLRGLEHLATNSPRALLVDLSRLPSHGRKIASWIRRLKTTRHIPSVFGGEPEKVLDYKNCAVDETWSGLVFARRRGRPS